MRRFVFLLVSLFLAAQPPVVGALERYIEGIHYLEVPEPQPVETGRKIEVREVFWYGCPHCYTLEPTIKSWLKTKPANAEFVRVPGILRAEWEPHARAFYTFQALGALDKLHEPFFRAIHQKRQALNDVQSIADFAAAHGIDKSRFRQVYNSFGVNTKVNKAKQAGERYRLNAVPTLIVDGTYSTSPTMAGGNKAVMDVVNFLVEKAAGERKKTK